jgi:hypothetical protein
MTKRLSAGVLLAACAVIFTAVCAFAEHPLTREWRGGIDPHSTLPLFFRSSTGTTWVQVGQNCDGSDTSGSQTRQQVWCFEGASGDSTWPSVPPAQNGHSLHETWTHWSKFNPPVLGSSKWWVTRYRPGGGGGTYSAWCGCDSLLGNPACNDVAFWVFKTGYGNDWNYALTLDMSTISAASGGTVQFDIRYDSECNYDYTYLEYFDTGTSAWTQVQDGTAHRAIFNAVSGNNCTAGTPPGTGRCCGTDYFKASDQHNPGGGNITWHGNSAWVTNVTFPMHVQATGGMKFRWRCTSDGAFSDADGRGDTDGIAAIDNVKVFFTATHDTISDNFESGNFAGLKKNGAPAGAFASWGPGSLMGNTFDGWHMEFDPTYKNKGNTCTFSNDWMWTTRGIPSGNNNWDYYLVSPVINCNGWSGGTLDYDDYQCEVSTRKNYTNTLLRLYNHTNGWSLWNDYDIFVTFQGCNFWNVNDTETLTPFLGSDVDSVQLAFEMLDVSKSGEIDWGNHAGVAYLVDNVSVGSFDGSSTVFTLSGISIFSDTFSRVDPSHTANMRNSEEGNWVGNGGTRRFATVDSLSVIVNDFDGVTNGNVRLFWRVGTGTPPVFGSWSNKQMVYSGVDPTSPTDEGTYQSVIGNTGSERYSSGGAFGNGALPIWDSGQTVEYYVRCQDNNGALAYLLNVGQITDPNPQYLKWQILPFNRIAASGKKILIVDDYARNDLDFEHSTGYDPNGGVHNPNPQGTFTSPVFDQPENMTERALALMYGGSEDYVAGVYGSPKWDIYNVAGAGSSVQREPRVISNLGAGLGGIASDTGSPNYDAVVWLQGSFDAYSYADTTRIQLKVFLDSGGHLFNTGDDVASFLGTAGANADSVINFLGPYLGMTYTNSNDDGTVNNKINMVGDAGRSLAGLVLGNYGDCPGLRRDFDRVEVAASVSGQYQATELATYGGSVAADNGRTCAVKCVRTGQTPNGVAVSTSFDIGCLLNDASRACLLTKVFVTDFGLPATLFTGCVNSGVDAPLIANSRFGFELAQARPNPFSDATTIAFSVPNRTHVQIEVYNILGQKVRTLVNETMEANSYVRQWDGRADGGTKVSSGIYFYKMVAGDFSATRKAVLLK